MKPVKQTNKLLPRFRRTRRLKTKNEISNPEWLLAELTYRCPLHCPYCSNPVELSKYKNELSTEEWVRVLVEGSQLGILQLGFSGGEPLARSDLEILVKRANELGYYTNLITSGIGLTETRISTLKNNGLDSIQISFQSDEDTLNDYISGRKNSFIEKMNTAKLIKKYGFPLTFNIVLHSKNISRINKILDMAIDLGADYIELANTQYSGGFAFENRDYLLPTLEQVQYAKQVSMEYSLNKSNPKIYYVFPDYYQGRPKACMNGWGSTYMVVTPDGSILPCVSARLIPDIEIPNVKQVSMSDAWYSSEMFNKFRGYDWMPEPCRSCPEKTQDFGGCRCQAMLLTGNASETDPVCSLSPKHSIVQDAILDIKPDSNDFTFRTF